MYTKKKKIEAIKCNLIYLKHYYKNYWLIKWLIKVVEILTWLCIFQCFMEVYHQSWATFFHSFNVNNNLIAELLKLKSIHVYIYFLQCRISYGRSVLIWLKFISLWRRWILFLTPDSCALSSQQEKRKKKTTTHKSLLKKGMKNRRLLDE